MKKCCLSFSDRRKAALEESVTALMENLGVSWAKAFTLLGESDASGVGVVIRMQL